MIDGAVWLPKEGARREWQGWMVVFEFSFGLAMVWLIGAWLSDHRMMGMGVGEMDRGDWIPIR